MDLIFSRPAEKMKTCHLSLMRFQSVNASEWVSLNFHLLLCYVRIYNYHVASASKCLSSINYAQQPHLYLDVPLCILFKTCFYFHCVCYSNIKSRANDHRHCHDLYNHKCFEDVYILCSIITRYTGAEYLGCKGTLYNL